MKKHLFTLLFILFTIISGGAVKKVETNHINVAIMIVEKGDNAKITKIFDYYGYTIQDITDGFQVLKHPNGSEMHYLFSHSNDGGIITKVIVKPRPLIKKLTTS